jgi:N-acetylglucosaminyldiphosphoundecaprenol N-acetyl-beta-D-mannosaminyltransferase
LSRHPQQEFYNLRIDVLDREGFFRELRRELAKPGQVSINFLNAHCFNVAQSNPEYRDALERCTFLLNDGVGVDFAGRLRGIRFPENLNGTDLIPDMLEFFQENGMSVYFFGAKNDVIERAARVIESRYPRLSVGGCSHGYIEDPTVVIDRINAAKADVVILGLGVPKQELWADDHGDQLESTKVLVCGGAIFDFLSGNVIRAPGIVRRLRLEWLFRLIQEPRRLSSRYILGGFQFVYYLLAARR